MATVDRHENLFSTDLKYFKSLQLIRGKSIYDRYKIARASIIGKYIEDRYQDFLAHPVKEGDKVEFYGIKARNDEPQILAELQSTDADKYQKIKLETLQHYQSKIKELKDIGKYTEAEFLTDATKTVDDRFIFCYDDKVILGAWGMQIRENARQDIKEIRKSIPKKRTKTQNKDIVPDKKNTETPISELFKIHFNEGVGGILEGKNELYKNDGDYVTENDIPKITVKEGYKFAGWDETPNGYNVKGNKEFTAQYRKDPITYNEEPKNIQSEEESLKDPWWRRLWLWFMALFAPKGCLYWLFRVLLFILLLLLIVWMLKNCHGGACKRIIEDGSERVGGIYNPENPYTPPNTPPDYEDILPPHEGVMPPVEGNPEITPGNPSVIANRLNILMDNADKSILDLAKDFKEKYPDEKYTVVYYDNVVKRMQIEVPKEERNQLKRDIPNVFAQDYNLFVFDEALFEGRYRPNDPAFSDFEKSWYLDIIHAPQAWDITMGNEEIIVAIIDNGFNLKHPELESKVVKPYNVWKHSDEILPQEVDHGTHVAGTALALANNSEGLCGIAPNCKFMPVQVADEQELMTTTSVLDGILFAIYQGADVINVSLGASFDGFVGYDENMQKELINSHFKEEERLWRHIMRIAANKRATIVVAAGNENMLAGIEALQRPELFITVSAIDKESNPLRKAEFSNYGPFSDISAPGVSIFSSVGNNDYESMDGTSMATPIISGAVALMKSINDSITNKEILCILQNTGIETQGKIGKLLQLDKALQQVVSGEKLDCTPEPTSGDVQILLSWDNYNDLDLIVTDPNGESVWFKNPRVSSGGKLEIDMNVEYPDSNTPIENIYWPSNSAPQGTYYVYLSYFKEHIDIPENQYHIKVIHGEKTDIYSGTIKNEKDTIQICTFTMGNTSSTQAPINTTPDDPNSAQVNDRKRKLEQERNRLQQKLDSVNEELKRIGNSL